MNNSQPSGCSANASAWRYAFSSWRRSSGARCSPRVSKRSKVMSRITGGRARRARAARRPLRLEHVNARDGRVGQARAQALVELLGEQIGGDNGRQPCVEAMVDELEELLLRPWRLRLRP